MRSVILGVVRYAAASVLSLVLSLSLTTLQVEIFGAGPLWSHVLTLIVVTTVNYSTLLWFVFPDHKVGRFRFFLAYVGSTLVFRMMEWTVYASLVGLLSVDYRWSILVVAPAFALMKFIFLRREAYRAVNPSTVRDGHND